MKLRQFVKKALSYFPSRLPTGMTEFETWSNDIIELTGPLAEATSLKFALADMILRIGPLKNDKYQTLPGSVPKNYFVQALRKIASSQIASGVLHQIKVDQEAAQKAAAEKTQAEATAATPEASTSEQVPNT
jgi:hypothetical protein